MKSKSKIIFFGLLGTDFYGVGGGGLEQQAQNKLQNTMCTLYCVLSGLGYPIPGCF